MLNLIDQNFYCHFINLTIFIFLNKYYELFFYIIFAFILKISKNFFNLIIHFMYALKFINKLDKKIKKIKKNYRLKFV